MKKRGSATPWQLSFLGGATVGVIIFLTLYGTRVLDVTYEDWLLTEWYDLSQHYVGWKLYRASSWHFPVGLCDNSFYPYLASVIYTDSLPLLSLIFKLLSPVLPEAFQFFGLYALFCFVMQGGIAALLLRRIFDREWQRLAACIPFVLSAPLIQRVFYHTALASHYLILLALLLFVYRDKVPDKKRRVALWSALGALCISLHFTIYGIVSVMLLGFALWEALDSVADLGGLTADFFSYIIPYLAVSVAVFYLLGGFYGGISGESSGLGDYSANLNSLFNPIDYSCLLKELPSGDNQYEGLAYIGIAPIIMMFFALPNIVRRRRYLFAAHKNYIISILVTGALLWLIALSPKIMLGKWVIAEVPWPKFITDLWSIFRSSGRFLWPVTYAVMLIFMYFARQELKSGISVLLILACALQLYEFHDKAHELSERYTEVKRADFSAMSLESYDLSGIKHLQFMHPYYFGEFYGDEVRDQMIGYTQLALKHGMTVSNFHFSRDDMDVLREQIEYCKGRLRRGDPEPDTMYVFRSEDFYDGMLWEKYKGVDYVYTATEVIALPQNRND